MNVAVVGTGYVGLVAGACFADTGNTVLCVDTDLEKIRNLSAGILPVYEPGLLEIVLRNAREDRLFFTTDIDSAVRDAQVVFLTIGSSAVSNDLEDLGPVVTAARNVAQSMNGYKVIVIKSTVPVGTTEKLRELIQQTTKEPFDIVFNPEFLKAGGAVEDFLKPDRLIIGCDNPTSGEIVQELYAPFLRTGNPVLMMDIRSAELTRYAANTALAARMTLMNELANICEQVGADIDMVRKGVGSDKRIGPAFLFPGIGYGDSCFPIDIRTLIQTTREHYVPRMIEAINETNQAQPARFANRIASHFDQAIEKSRLAVWGLSFKAYTSDIRESPAIKIIQILLDRGLKIAAYDPEAMQEAVKILGDRIEFLPDSYACLKGADALAVLTDWAVFRNPHFDRMKRLMRHPVIFDGHNIYDPRHIRGMGFTYYGVGRVAIDNY